MATNDGPLISGIEYPSSYVNQFSVTISLSGSPTLSAPTAPFVLDDSKTFGTQDAVNVSYLPYTVDSTRTQPFVMRFGEQEWSDPGTGATWYWDFNVDCIVSNVSPGGVDGRPFMRTAIVRDTGTGWVQMPIGVSVTDLFLPNPADPNVTYTVGPPYVGNPAVSVQSTQRSYFLSELAAGRLGLLMRPGDLVAPADAETDDSPWATTASAIIDNWTWANAGAFLFDTPAPTGVYKVRMLDGSWYTLGSGSQAKIRALDGSWYVESVAEAEATVRLLSGSLGPRVDFGKESP